MGVLHDCNATLGGLLRHFGRATGQQSVGYPGNGRRRIPANMLALHKLRVRCSVVVRCHACKHGDTGS